MAMCIAKATAVVVCLVALSSGAYGQVTVIYDCTEQYTTTSGQLSQKGEGAHIRLYQPMDVFSVPYTVTHVTVFFNPATTTDGPFSIADLVGRTATLEFLFGEYNDEGNFFDADSSVSNPTPIVVTFTADNVSLAAEDTVNFRQFDIDVSVPVPSGKQLHIGLIGDFNFVTPENEVFAISESVVHAGENPLPHESGWRVQPDEPGQPHLRISQVAGLVTGNLPMRVTANMGTLVPTVSEWGVAAMSLLLLTAGTLALRSREHTRASPSL